jgi:hypothetical protein
MCPKIDLNAEFDKIKIVVQKRGVFLYHDSKSGVLQGFTGTLDTHLHYCLAAYSIRTAKDKDILTSKQTAQVLILIDDGVIALRLTGGLADQQNICSTFRQHVIDTYKMLRSTIGETIYKYGVES